MVEGDTAAPTLEEMLLRVGTAERAVDALWVTFATAMVLFMQMGFAALEVGAVRTKNTRTILLKNILDFSVGTLTFWALGYGVAYGGGNNQAGGRSGYFLSDTLVPQVSDGEPITADDLPAAAAEGTFAHFTLLLAYACTSTTIVSGALAERVRLRAFLIFTGLSCWILSPLPMRWTWYTGGWLNASALSTTYAEGRALLDVGVVDFAGAGVVHAVGGFCALVAAKMAGPRLDERGVKRFEKGVREHDFAPHGPALSIIGALCLLFSWYGFNAGSTLAIVGQEDVVASVLVTTTLSGASAMIAGSAMLLASSGSANALDLTNCLLAGLVSVTAGCAVFEAWASVVTGILSSAVYIGASKLLKRFKIDDPLDASALHGACGSFGVVAVGLFASSDLIEQVYGPGTGEHYGLLLGGGWRRFGAQIVGVVLYAAWSLAFSVLLFYALKYSDRAFELGKRMVTGKPCEESVPNESAEDRERRVGNGLRVSREVEMRGIDVSHHAGLPYPPYLAPFIDSVNIVRELQLASLEQSDPVPAPAHDGRGGATSSPASSPGAPRADDGSFHEFNLLLRPRVNDLKDDTVHGASSVDEMLGDAIDPAEVAGGTPHAVDEDGVRLQGVAGGGDGDGGEAAEGGDETGEDGDGTGETGRKPEEAAAAS